MIASIVLFLPAISAVQFHELVRTGPKSSGHFIASQATSDGTDKVYLAKYDRKKVVPLLTLPVTRRDRNVPDLLHVAGDRAIALVNGGVDLHEPFFLQRHQNRWQLVAKPKKFEGIPGGSTIVRIGAFLVGTMRSNQDGDQVEYFLFAYGPRGLKIAKAPDGLMDVRNISPNSLALEFWRTRLGKVEVQVRKYRWPIFAKNGHWVLVPY